MLTRSSAIAEKPRDARVDSQNCEVEFLSHPFGGLGETWMLHVYVVGRSVVDFL